MQAIHKAYYASPFSGSLACSDVIALGEVCETKRKHNSGITSEKKSPSTYISYCALSPIRRPGKGEGGGGKGGREPGRQRLISFLRLPPSSFFPNRLSYSHSGVRRLLRESVVVAPPLPAPELRRTGPTHVDADEPARRRGAPDADESDKELPADDDDVEIEGMHSRPVARPHTDTAQRKGHTAPLRQRPKQSLPSPLRVLLLCAPLTSRTSLYPYSLHWLAGRPEDTDLYNLADVLGSTSAAKEGADAEDAGAGDKRREGGDTDKESASAGMEIEGKPNEPSDEARPATSVRGRICCPQVKGRREWGS